MGLYQNEQCTGLRILLDAGLRVAFRAHKKILQPLPFMAIQRRRRRAARPTPFLFTEKSRLISGRLHAINRIARLHFPSNRDT